MRRAKVYGLLMALAMLFMAGLCACSAQPHSAAETAPQTIVVAGESGRIAESLKGFLWQLKEDASTALENGWLAGELAELAKKNRKQQ